MKEASVNYIRTSHYPREPRFYELADSLGFYVIDEVPFGYGDKNLSDSTFYPVLQQRAQATIRRDKNHPSVLVWSLGNENPLTDICVKLGNYVKSELDPGRPICYPMIGSYFRKFNYDSRKIACYYGIAPFGKDSGTSVHTDPHVHYMANRQIKAMLTQAALAAVNFNQHIASYYSRLIARGKKKQVALNNVKNKLVHIATAMVKNKQVFDKNYMISA